MSLRGMAWLLGFVLQISIISSGLISFDATEAQRGCCSWHGGVNMCDSESGRLVCNDGTYSPSCGCAISAPKLLPAPVVIPEAPSASASASKSQICSVRFPGTYFNAYINKCACGSGTWSPLHFCSGIHDCGPAGNYNRSNGKCLCESGAYMDDDGKCYAVKCQPAKNFSTVLNSCN